MKSANVSASQARKERDEAVSCKLKAVERVRQISIDKDEAFKLLEQSEWDFALQEEELNLTLECLSDPAFVFEKEQKGRAKRWSLRIVQLVMELLVSGTAPASVSDAIVAFVKNLAPDIKLRQLPSLSFIRRCRTILVITCQLTAVYRLAKAPKWGTIHTDGTSRRQVCILNLIITILEERGEPNFIPILASTSILPEDETAITQEDAIITFLEERKEWLGKWKEVIERDFPDFVHDIDPDGLDLVKMGSGGNVMTYGCNTAQKLNRLLVATIKAHFIERQGQSVGAIIADSINDTPPDPGDAADVNRVDPQYYHAGEENIGQ